MKAVDAIVVGAGHNGLVAATMLARAGRRVLVLERAAHVGGAAVSSAPFAGVDARISRYAYLVSLFPRPLLSELGIDVELRRRRVSSYTPCGDAGVLVCDDARRTRASIARTLGHERTATALERFGALTAGVAGRVFPTLTKPLLSRDAFRRVVGDEQMWTALFEQPLSKLLEGAFDSDLARGIVATDALIGTFADTDDAQLRQNRCFLYHVIGDGTGRWDVPVGGMGALTDALAGAAEQAGAELRVNSPVVSIRADARRVEVETADGTAYESLPPARQRGTLGACPLAGRSGARARAGGLATEGQPAARPATRACATTRSAAPTRSQGRSTSTRATNSCAGPTLRRPAGRIPDLPPCEAYCHSLTDASILTPALRSSRRSHPHRLRAAHAGETVPRRSRRGQARRRAGDAALARLGPGRADRRLPAAHP
jgi:phytoene dehydrogenase-like protein